ncbi:MAG: response regulator transcription factor [Rhodospirillales bacterium]|nr:response regulator transcription factor [Rhodospirillales bacterium]
MRVLIIEDSVDLGFAISERLKSNGYSVEHCLNGEDGEEFARNGAFDVLVLDINLPGRSGFEVLKNLRRSGNSMPILILTARSQIDDKIDLLDHGADDHMVKPFSLDELEARIRAVARRQMGVAQSRIEVGSVNLDLKSRSVMVCGQPLNLGRREYALLEALISQFGSTVLKDALVFKLFGHDDLGSPNAIELLVSRLRRKLSHSGLEIVTQRGIGYALLHSISDREQ